ncbi:MAG: radical SAM protein [Nitrospirota bacterium]|nr:radical SAM protein [Nitrospirota bacterium]
MLKIGFVFPSSEYLFDPFKGDPHTHFQILTVLENHFGNKVELLLIDLRGIKKDFAIYHIPECDLYLHSVYTLDWDEQISIVKNLREKYPKAKHIAGGPHATVFQEESIKYFDALIIGDGEENIVKAVEDFKNHSLQTIYEETSIIDINKYDFPRRHFLPKTAIARKGLMTLKYKKGFDELLGTTVIFSRGCPYDCYFCAMPQVKQYCPGVRYRKPELIEQEIEYLKREYGLQGISLLDEIGVPPGHEKAVKHLEAIGRTGIVWRGQCRVDGITPEIAKLLKDTGCVTMCLGVESAWQQSLDIINKKINIAKAKETIKLLEKNGIECRVYMIIGLPGEPENIVNITWDFIQETKPASVYLSILTVRPGTQLFNNPNKFGMKNINTDWSKTMHMYGRYEEEIPSLTFEYEDTTPWGKGFDKERIVSNYLELQSRLHKAGLSHI